MEKQQQSTHLSMSGAHLVEELRIDEHEEPLVHWLHVLIRICVRLLAVLMTLVIMGGSPMWPG